MARRVFVAAVTLLALGVLGVSAASAATLTVCESGPPKCGYKRIQEAINAAKAGDTIKIAAGSYSAGLVIGKNLKLEGAGAGLTIIEGARETSGVSVNAPASVMIDGVTLSNNSAIEAGFFGCGCNGGAGGGIHNTGTLTLNSSTVSNNKAGEGGGGGIYNLGTLTLNSSTVSNNEASLRGGGIANSGTLTLNNSTVSNNEAHVQAVNVAVGGGIYNDGTLTLNTSTVSDNKAGIGGGGIFNSAHGTATLTNSTISKNKAGGNGGGISNEGTLTLNTSTISDNEASHGGGIYNTGTVKGSGDTITGNTPNGIENTGTGRDELKNSKVQSP